MPANVPSKRRSQKIVFALLLLLICIVACYSVYEENRPWVIPEEFKRLKNPLQPSDSNLKAARDLYRDECAQCHGDHGKGDGPESKMHSPAPADLTDAGMMNGVTDGEIFYQITAGRRPMPSFKSRTTEDQRWQMALLVRSFSQKTAAPDRKSDDTGEKPPLH
jgi:mono/diheme cytochrome c family protein